MKKPNILVFMTDQQHFNTIGKDSLCNVPNINKLIDNGVLFNNAFCPSPVCTPSRTSFQTGLLPHQHRMMHNAQFGKNYHIQEDIPEGIDLLGGSLSDEGYKTAYIGKWDSGMKKGPIEHGYDYYEKIRSNIDRDDFIETVRIEGEKEERRAIISAITKTSVEKTETSMVANTVCQYIDNLSKKDEPFFIFSTTRNPHVPWICPKEYADMYPPETIVEWNNYKESFENKPKSYLRHYNKQNYCRIAEDWKKMSKALSCYFGIISLIDNAFGRIISSLEKNGCMENTLIIFTSDHGELMGEHSLIGKNDNLLDPLIRIPLVISFKKMFKHNICDSFINLIDIYTTILDIIGSSKGRPSTSRSLLPLLKGETKDNFPDKIFIEHNGTNLFNVIRAVRTRYFKYIFRPHEFDEFYDLRDDPDELLNRIDDKNYQSLIKNLRRELVKWMYDTGDMAAKGAQYILIDQN